MNRARAPKFQRFKTSEQLARDFEMRWVRFYSDLYWFPPETFKGVAVRLAGLM